MDKLNPDSALDGGIFECYLRRDTKHANYAAWVVTPEVYRLDVFAAGQYRFYDEMRARAFQEDVRRLALAVELAVSVEGLTVTVSVPQPPGGLPQHGIVIARRDDSMRVLIAPYGCEDKLVVGCLLADSGLGNGDFDRALYRDENVYMMPALGLPDLSSSELPWRYNWSVCVLPPAAQLGGVKLTFRCRGMLRLELDAKIVQFLHSVGISRFVFRVPMREAMHSEVVSQV